MSILGNVESHNSPSTFVVHGGVSPLYQQLGTCGVKSVDEYLNQNTTSLPSTRSTCISRVTAFPNADDRNTEEYISDTNTSTTFFSLTTKVWFLAAADDIIQYGTGIPPRDSESAIEEVHNTTKTTIATIHEVGWRSWTTAIIPLWEKCIRLSAPVGIGLRRKPQPDIYRCTGPSRSPSYMHVALGRKRH